MRCGCRCRQVPGEAPRRFWIEDDAFWKDGAPFQIVGGDVHYFRIVPEVNKSPLFQLVLLYMSLQSAREPGVEWFSQLIRDDK